MRRIVTSLLVLLILGGCSYHRQVQRRSSLVAYLYPEHRDVPPPNPDVRLQLPLRIGIGFIPPDIASRAAASTISIRSRGCSTSTSSRWSPSTSCR